MSLSHAEEGGDAEQIYLNKSIGTSGYRKEAAVVRSTAEIALLVVL